MQTWASSTDDARGTRRAGSRKVRPASVVGDCAPSWTGRAATSRATDSGVPHFVSAGTRRTRVSEMRIAAARDGFRSANGARTTPPAVPPAPLTRRRLAWPLSDDIRNGG